MEVISVKHKADILIGEYQFVDKVKSEVLSLLNKGVVAIPQNNSNVKASLHTEWNWEPENITFRNLKSYIREEIERHYKPGAMSGGGRDILKVVTKQPFEILGIDGKYDVSINVSGGGLSGQAGAIRLGISRGIEKVNPDYRKILKENGFLTRDSRRVERKKPGQPGARKKFQFSKR